MIAPSYLEAPKQKWILAAPQVDSFAVAFHAQLTDQKWALDQIAEDCGQLFEEQLSRRDSAEQVSKFWLVGWSDKHQQCGILQFNPHGPAGACAKPVRAAVSHELDADNREALEALVINAVSHRQVDLVAFGVALLEAQRRVPAPLKAGGQLHFHVGGYAVQTEITRDGIRHDVIHHWPDKIGERIDPFGLARSAVS